jgi:signal transduction histidine kinase
MSMEAEPLRPQPDAETWARAIGLVTSAPVAEEALSELLGEATVASGAGAGAFIEGAGARCRVMYRLDEGDLEPLLGPGGAVAATYSRQDTWPDAPFWLSRSVLPHAEVAGEAGRFLLAPLRVRGVSLGGLLLFYRSDLVPTAEQARYITAFAGLGALVLEHDQLFEEARRALQARDHFLTAINHELRTPATALMLNAGLIHSGLMGQLPQPLQKRVQALESDVAELVRVIANVLDLGKLESGSTPASADLVNPRELVLELLRRVEPSANRKALSLSVFVPRALPLMQTDRERVSRILLHLFANAIKYTEQGGIQVRVERSTAAAGTAKREAFLFVRVTDTGRGIPPEEMERIFEPFAQVEEGARTDSQQRGIGLGLPLARKLARSLGGDVLVDSPVGRGTVATLQLPYRQPASG